MSSPTSDNTSGKGKVERVAAIFVALGLCFLLLSPSIKVVFSSVNTSEMPLLLSRLAAVTSFPVESSSALSNAGISSNNNVPVQRAQSNANIDCSYIWYRQQLKAAEQNVKEETSKSLIATPSTSGIHQSSQILPTDVTGSLIAKNAESSINQIFKADVKGPSIPPPASIHASSITSTSQLVDKNALHQSGYKSDYNSDVPLLVRQDRVVQHQNASNLTNIERISIALVQPTFTAAAYDDAFYLFYGRHNSDPIGKNVTTDLGLLRTRIPARLQPNSSNCAMPYLLNRLQLTMPSSSVTMLTDQDVDRGAIFKNGGAGNTALAKDNNRYDIVVIGHQEYVTQHEYDNLKNFVANGGTLVILDGNVFYAQVSYDNLTDTIQLVRGHGWAFNGKSAWRSVEERWASDNSEWMGSNYLCYYCHVNFGNNPFGYIHHEENYISNPNDAILLNYNASISGWDYPPADHATVATYELTYGKGRVINLGIYADDIIATDRFENFFNGLLFSQANKQME
jgi:hypothetical protein